MTTSLFALKFATGFLLMQGSVSGTVINASTGEPLQGVSVFVDGTARGAATNAEGRFVITDVAPGMYSVTAKRIGFAEALRAGVRVSEGGNAFVDFSMSTQALRLQAVLPSENRSAADSAAGAGVGAAGAGNPTMRAGSVAHSGVLEFGAGQARRRVSTDSLVQVAFSRFPQLFTGVVAEDSTVVTMLLDDSGQIVHAEPTRHAFATGADGVSLAEYTVPNAAALAEHRALLAAVMPEFLSGRLLAGG